MLHSAEMSSSKNEVISHQTILYKQDTQHKNTYSSIHTHTYTNTWIAFIFALGIVLCKILPSKESPVTLRVLSNMERFSSFL